MIGPDRRRAGRNNLPALIACLVLAAVAGCSSAGNGAPGGDREIHGDGEGPLSVVGPGGNSIAAPKHTPWVATFGWSTPCTTTGDPIEIEKINYRFTVHPKAVRSVIFDAVPAHGVVGFGSTIGKPENAVRKGHVAGTFLGQPEGFEVTRSCDSDTSQGKVQILTVLTTGPRGAEVRDYSIDYTSEGEKYTLEVEYQMIACGTDTPPAHCT